MIEVPMLKVNAIIAESDIHSPPNIMLRNDSMSSCHFRWALLQERIFQNNEFLTVSAGIPS